MELSEIKSLMANLEKAPTPERILEILKLFEKGVKPTEKLLRETKLGIAVNKLRAHPSKEISEAVKRIVKKWKDEVSAQKQRKGQTNSKPAPPTVVKESPAVKEPSKTNEEKEEPKFTAEKPRNSKNDGVNTSFYDDKVRNSCLDLCYNALVIDSQVLPATVLSVAKKVELVVFEGEHGVTTGYRNKMRSLYLNLKDKSNPQLRERVVSGDITPQRLYTMTPQEMAPKELKEEIEKIEKKNLFNAQGATEKRAITDRFTCGKCKQKKVSYYQMQTRSADEPLTTFCTCENCGQRWKFS